MTVSLCPNVGWRKLLYNPPLHLHLLAMNLVILLLIFPLVTFTLLHNYEKFHVQRLTTQFEQMRQGVELQVSSLMESMLSTAVFALGSYEFYLLQQQVKEVARHDEMIRYIVFMDYNGSAVVHSSEDLLLTLLDSPMDKKAMEFLAGLDGEKEGEVFFFSNEEEAGPGEPAILEGIIPIYSAGELWGALRCGYSLERLNDSLLQAKINGRMEITNFRNMLYGAMAGAILMAVVVAVFFSRFLTRSTTLLAHGVEQVTAGKLDYHIDQPNFSCDEFCRLSVGFNQMTSSLAEARSQLDRYSHSLEQKVEDRTRQLREAQDELVGQAREAGMAEMAIGVLHNIGNAITPAKVNISLLHDRVRDATLPDHLDKALSPLLQVIEAATDIDDEQREKLSRIVKLLPGAIAEQNNYLRDELEKVQGKHRHIEEIIRLQMRYARLDACEEDLQVSRVVKDAVNMLADSLRKRKIKVEKDLPDLPLIRMEHARLMQIVVNLIKNGYESIDVGVTRGDGLLTVTSGLVDDMVFVSVRDNGQGFSPEEAEKMFNYGYTTKERGSGFGLHSAANFLIARQGSLVGRSDGPGLGAEFVISLPISG